MYEGDPSAPVVGVDIFIYHTGKPMICVRAKVPTDMLKHLQPRKQHIGQLEVLACLLGPYAYPDYFRDCDVMHYQDNTSALAGAIRGGSKVPDTNYIFQLLAMHFWRR